MGEAPLRRELLDQLLERHVLVYVGGERRLPHPPEQLTERRPPSPVSREIATQHQGVDEEPDQRFDLAVCASRDR